MLTGKRPPREGHPGGGARSNPACGGVIARADADGDGVLTKEELTKMAERQTAGGGRGGFASGPGGGQGGPGGGGAGGRGGAGGFGPPNPQAFVDRAMEFDADKDGKLS